jgi:hypothetical protein
MYRISVPSRSPQIRRYTRINESTIVFVINSKTRIFLRQINFSTYLAKWKNNNIPCSISDTGYRGELGYIYTFFKLKFSISHMSILAIRHLHAFVIYLYMKEILRKSVLCYQYIHISGY